MFAVGERLNRLSASEIAQGIRAGAFTAEAVVRDCLARIERRESIIQAWSSFDSELALRQARECDRGARNGPLCGVPIGVKDVIDTADLPTEMGSPIYRDYRPPSDASCIAIVRAAGAVILGKTVTAEFAGMTPGATTNPHNPDCSPGGSSGGSGAAVADFMVSAAFGTQTGGSVLRPASYCGVIGYKPSFGLINREGIKPAAETLDTVGLLARTIDDVELITDVLLGRTPVPHAAPSLPPKIGLCRTYLWSEVKAETAAAVEDAAGRLAAAGAPVREVTLPEAFRGLSEARESINDYERARAMAYEWNNHRALISERLANAIRRGFEMPVEKFIAAVRLAEHCRDRLDVVFGGVDVLLAPCVDREAPRGLKWAGEPKFQALWTLLRTPTLTLPTHRGPNGLPVGIQLVGRLYDDKRLLSVARWMLQQLGSTS